MLEKIEERYSPNHDVGPDAPIHWSVYELMLAVRALSHRISHLESRKEPAMHANHRNGNHIASGDSLSGALRSAQRTCALADGIKTLIQIHSTRERLLPDQDTIDYLIEERNKIVAELDQTILRYASATGTSVDLVED